MTIGIPRIGVDLSALQRLDISYNNITSLPQELYSLQTLKELWLNNNPIKDLSPRISECEALEVLDVRSTQICDLPNTVCLLKKIYELDFNSTPLQSFLEKEHGIVPGDMYGLKSLYKYRYDRSNLRDMLREKLENEQFPADADKYNFFAVIEQVTHTHRRTQHIH